MENLPRHARLRCRRPRAHAVIAVAVASALAGVHASAQVTSITLPPLNGFQPLVIMGVTDEQFGASSDFNGFFAQPSSTPGGNGVPSHPLPLARPVNQPDWPMFIAIVDTGAQSSILSLEAQSVLNLTAA